MDTQGHRFRHGSHSLTLKDSQPTLHQFAQEKLDGRLADWTSGTECAHGRIERRELRMVPLDLDTTLFSRARQLLSLPRWYRDKKGAEDFKSETRCFLTSLSEGEERHARLAEIARGHGAVENKNHWKKDATLWREDRGTRHQAQGAGNPALLRNAILALIRHDEQDSLNQAFLHYANHRSDTHLLLTQTPPSHA